MTRLTALFRASTETQQQDLAAAEAARRPVESPVDEAVAEIAQNAQFARASEEYENLADAKASLEAALASLESELDTGLSPHAAYYMNLLVDNASQRAGFHQPATPSMEQFQGRRARVSTTLSIEGIRERIAEVTAKMEQVAARRDALKPAA